MLLSTMFLLAAISRLVICREATCPSCVDEEFTDFTISTKFSTPKNYDISAALWPYRCRFHEYKEMSCASSCVRIQLIQTEMNNTKVLGAMYGCTTLLILRVPPAATHIPSDYRRLKGDWHYQDPLSDQQSRHFATDVQFYKSGRLVEKVLDYNRRIHREKKQQRVTEHFNKNLFENIKSRYLKSEQFFYGVAVAAIIIVAILFVLGIVFLCKKINNCCLKKKLREAEPLGVIYCKEITPDGEVQLPLNSTNRKNAV